ncbi:MAG: glycosyltransferase [Candidatus Omnitrophota bacterium]|nr:glycosyltransferase [Candidatus Omnitrophota bacterium]
MKREFSIVVCTYNRAESLRECLASIVADSGFDELVCDVVVVDNNSKDHTRVVVESFQKATGPAIRYVFEARQGVAHARNAGIRAAEGSIVVSLDDDVIVTEGWLAGYRRCFEETDADVVGGKIDRLWRCEVPEWYSEDLGGCLINQNFGQARMRCDSPRRHLVTAALAVRKKAFELYGDFNVDLGRRGDSLIGGEDREFYQRVLAKSGAIYYEPASLVMHIVEKDRLTKEYMRRWFRDVGITLGHELAAGRQRCVTIAPVWVWKRLLFSFIRFHRAHLNIHETEANRFASEMWLGHYAAMVKETFIHWLPFGFGKNWCVFTQNKIQEESKMKSVEKKAPIVTVVVVPRESFNAFGEVVQRMIDVTTIPFKMIIMEGHCPKDRLAGLEKIAGKHSNVEIVYSDRWQFPHQFVNQAIPMIDTKYACFIDNDVEVLEGWLENLVACAEEEKVDCVHPIYLTVELSDPSRKIHIAEGKIYKEKRGDKWLMDTIPTYSGVELKDYPDQNRKPSDFFEWHTVLLSKKLMEKVGPLRDLNIAEHMDYSLRITEAGFRIMLEPKSVVAYNYERIFKFRGADRGYMLFRWDLDKVSKSHELLCEKWNLDEESVMRRAFFAREHRARVKSTYFMPRAINKVRRMVGLKNRHYYNKPKPAPLAVIK